ncbi:hypothetical protein FA13DRAFT_1731695 [Coprinellus micaceus]|uniref:Uncharacterized protein n=1 Tax=Coprinellus micaceus TaxID=71717 RepID=A0A4Y7TEQ1_COPMI|nr:hypothetical protein FA13DRAFT_1731695 [Coprinellus micaceus]
MLLKVSTVVFAAATFVSASPTIAKRGEATCNINVTGFTFPRSDPPPLPAGETLTTEWNYLTGRLFAESFPSGTTITVGNSTVEGPVLENGGTYHITQALGSAGVTDAEAADIVLGWAGKDVSGPFSGVLYHIDNTDCA